MTYLLPTKSGILIAIAYNRWTIPPDVLWGKSSITTDTLHKREFHLTLWKYYISHLTEDHWNNAWKVVAHSVRLRTQDIFCICHRLWLTSTSLHYIQEIHPYVLKVDLNKNGGIYRLLLHPLTSDLQITHIKQLSGLMNGQLIFPT